jgi:hypothetical protein
MVSINLATGTDLERIEHAFEQLLERSPPVRIRISLLDYRDPTLMKALASILGTSDTHTASAIEQTMDSLLAFRIGLERSQQAHLELFLHRTIPSASAIMVDANLPCGRIQLETKPYRAPRNKSWALEVESGSEFFETLRESYHRIITDGHELDVGGLPKSTDHSRFTGDDA